MTKLNLLAGGGKSLELLIKKPPIFTGGFGGPVRIRTAVGAFAELCLATRPQDHF